MLQDHAGDPVWARRFVVRGTPESLLHDSWFDATRYYWDCVFLVERNAKLPWERCSVRERGVKRHGLSFKFLYLCDDLCRVHQEAARGVVSEDREVRREGLRVMLLRCGA